MAWHSCGESSHGICQAGRQRHLELLSVFTCLNKCSPHVRGCPQSPVQAAGSLGVGVTEVVVNCLTWELNLGSPEEPLALLNS